MKLHELDSHSLWHLKLSYASFYTDEDYNYYEEYEEYEEDEDEEGEGEGKE